MLGFHDEMRLAVMFDYLTFANVVGGWHGVVADRSMGGLDAGRISPTETAAAVKAEASNSPRLRFRARVADTISPDK
jgi:hypothetical protein